MRAGGRAAAACAARLGRRNALQHVGEPEGLEGGESSQFCARASGVGWACWGAEATNIGGVTAFGKAVDGTRCDSSAGFIELNAAQGSGNLTVLAHHSTCTGAHERGAVDEERVRQIGAVSAPQRGDGSRVDLGHPRAQDDHTRIS